MKLLGLGSAIPVGLLLIALNVEQTNISFIAANLPAVVKISGMKDVGFMRFKFSGTGFFIKDLTGKTRLITAGHVCEGENIDDLSLENSSYKGLAKVVKISNKADLCELSFSVEPNKVLRLSKERPLFERVYATGYPHGESITINVGITSNIVTIKESVPCTAKRSSAKFLISSMGQGNDSACIITQRYIAATTSPRPGDSGGPVMTRFGNVVGVTVAGIMGSNRGYIVPIEELLEFLQ